jgi:hypothetical protein
VLSIDNNRLTTIPFQSYFMGMTDTDMVTSNKTAPLNQTSTLGVGNETVGAETTKLFVGEPTLVTDMVSQMARNVPSQNQNAMRLVEKKMRVKGWLRKELVFLSE